MDQFNEILKSAANICWIPSAAIDFPSAYFINTFSDSEQADLFVFTDFIYRDDVYNLMNFNYESDEASVGGPFFDEIAESCNIQSIKTIRFNSIGSMHFGKEITRYGIKRGPASPLSYGEFLVQSKIGLPNKTLKVLFVGCYNEPFCNNFLIKNGLNVRFVVFKCVRGYGGDMSGLWIYNTLRTLKTKFLATEIIADKWNKYDAMAIEVYPELGPETNSPVYSPEENAVKLKIKGELRTLPNITVRKMRELVNHNSRTNSKWFGINELPEFV